jgi:acetyl-CoA synthetase
LANPEYARLIQIKTAEMPDVIFPLHPVWAAPMEWERISKRPDDFARANLKNYEGCVGSFSWVQARELLDGLPDGGLNIAYEAVDRHVLAGRGGKLALRWIGRDDAVRDLSYAQLRVESNRFANVLAQHGIIKGDRVFSLLGRCPELYVASLGTLKNGSVFSPLFSGATSSPVLSSYC